MDKLIRDLASAIGNGDENARAHFDQLCSQPDIKSVLLNFYRKTDSSLDYSVYLNEVFRFVTYGTRDLRNQGDFNKEYLFRCARLAAISLRERYGLHDGVQLSDETLLSFREAFEELFKRKKEISEAVAGLFAANETTSGFYIDKIISLTNPTLEVIYKTRVAAKGVEKQRYFEEVHGTIFEGVKNLSAPEEFLEYFVITALRIAREI